MEIRVTIPAIPESKLIKYETACRAVAEARSVDEARSWKDKSEAVRAYARQVKNRQLEIDAAEIRIRAERRIGELLQVLRLQKKWGYNAPGKKPVINSEELGLARSHTNEYIKLARLPEDKFKFALEKWRKDVANQTRGKLQLPLREVATPKQVEQNSKATSLRRILRGKATVIDSSDPYDRMMRMLDGRRYADILFGEIDRLIQATEGQLKSLKKIKAHIANVDYGGRVKDAISASVLEKIILNSE